MSGISIGNASRLTSGTIQLTDVLPIERPGVTTPYSATITDVLGGLTTSFLSQSNVFAAPQHIGADAEKASLPGFSIARTLTNSENARGFHDASVFGGALQKAYASFDAFAESAEAANLDHLIGFQARNEHAGTGTLDKWYGFGAFPNITGGDVANVYGYYGADPLGAGVITDNYGIYLASQTRGVTNYAIYTNAGAISLGASVTIRNGGLVTEAGGIVLASTNTPIQATRTVSDTTGLITLGLLLAKSSGDMADTFGSSITFSVQDDTSASTPLVQIGGVRAGADNTGDFVVTTAAAGTSTEKLRVTSGGDVRVIVGKLVPVLKAAASAPAYEKGALYFNTTSNKLMVGGATAWETITSA